jgi:hypothetical protein
MKTIILFSLFLVFSSSVNSSEPKERTTSKKQPINQWCPVYGSRRVIVDNEGTTYIGGKFDYWVTCFWVPCNFRPNSPNNAEPTTIPSGLNIEEGQKVYGYYDENGALIIKEFNNIQLMDSSNNEIVWFKID